MNIYYVKENKQDEGHHRSLKPERRDIRQGALQASSDLGCHDQTLPRRSRRGGNDTKDPRGAVLQDHYSINDRNKYLIGKEIEKHVKEKSSIGLKAASLVKPGETVAFDIGSTTGFIAKYIGREIEINALCVTFECAIELYHKKNVNLILTGGRLHRDSDVINSDEGIDIIKKIRTDKVFISAGGIDEKLGLTCYHDFHVLIKRALMESSKKIIDGSKDYLKETLGASFTIFRKEITVKD